MCAVNSSKWLFGETWWRECDDNEEESCSTADWKTLVEWSRLQILSNCKSWERTTSDHRHHRHINDLKQNTILQRQFYMWCCWSYWLFLIDWNQNSDENRSVYYSIIGFHQKRSGDTIRSKLTVTFSHHFDQIVCRAKDQWVLASGSWQKSSLLSIPESPEWSLSSPSSSPPLLLICLHFSSSSSSFFFSAALRGSSPQACFGFSGGEQYEMIAVVTWKRNFQVSVYIDLETSCKSAQFLPSPILLIKSSNGDDV